jgi:hypothetical protein
LRGKRSISHVALFEKRELQAKLPAGGCGGKDQVSQMEAKMPSAFNFKKQYDILFCVKKS